MIAYCLDADPLAEGFVVNFHVPDPNLVINALRLLLESLKIYGARGGQKPPDNREEVLKETVEKAEEMSAEGATTEQVVLEIETNLERELGPLVKNEIIARASSILAVAQPFEVEAFRYYDNLVLVLNRAQEFCGTTNIFKLRGEISGASEFLVLRKLASILPGACGDFKGLTNQIGDRDVLSVRLAKVIVYLVSQARALRVFITLDLKKAYAIGGSYTEPLHIELSLAKGSEVNKIGFDVRRNPGSYASPYLEGFEVRLTGKEFQGIVSAIFDDLNSYVLELGEEQKDFKERVGPALALILSAWVRS
jgi:hypothetical protein